MIDGENKLTFMRSKWAFAGSASRAPPAAAGSAARRRGTGPAATSPSKRWACRCHALVSTVGRLSLFDMYFFSKTLT
jgi:hypothetical protein